MPGAMYFLSSTERGGRDTNDHVYEGVWSERANAQAEVARRNDAIKAKNQKVIDHGVADLLAKYGPAKKRYDALVQMGLDTPSDVPVEPTEENAWARLEHWQVDYTEWLVDEIEVND